VGFEETPLTVQSCNAVKRKMRVLAPEQKRYVCSAGDCDATGIVVEDAGLEAVKRLSCKVKGQISACEVSA